MKDLRDWYRYLEGISSGSSSSVSAAPAIRPPVRRHRTDNVDSKQSWAEKENLLRTTRSDARSPLHELLLRQQRLAMDLGTPAIATRKPGRPPLTETREEIVRRLLDPELTLHEAAALLNLSKATLRRYTDQGKLPCTRTAGGQRRFKLSDVLVLLDQRPAPVEATR